MQLIFSNPLGWWGLLMLPALVLIHCLHVKRQPRIISTLFLLREHSSERRAGRSFAFWKHSVTFWLQVLAALLLTWLLLQPRWIGSETRQQIVLVLDSSLSMDAFREAMLRTLRSETASLSQTAARTHWLLTGSEARPQVLYSGDSCEELLRAAAQWRPSLGTHDWSAAVRAAHAQGGGQSVVIFVTDHPPETAPQNTHILGVGTPLPNTGFAGLHVEQREAQTVWRTLIKNYSDEPVERQWWIEIDGSQLPPRTIRIPADGSLALSGAMPEGVRAMTLVLEEDAWPLDNRLPFVLPERKHLSYRIEAGAQTDELERLLQSLPDTTRADDATRPDLLVSVAAAQQDAPADQTAAQQGGPADEIAAQQNGLTNTAASPSPTVGVSRIVFAPAQSGHALPTGPLSATLHPLNEGLNWNSLALHGDVKAHELLANQTPLLWLGGTPLIWISEHATGRDLEFNFSLSASNALKLPATVLLINRFAEELRSRKPHYEALNSELGQQLRLSLPAGAADVRLNGTPLPGASAQRVINAPHRPEFFSVSVNSETLLNGAAHFADVREADLRHAASRADTTALKRTLTETNSEADALQAWWLLLLAAALLASWHYAERGR